MGTFGKAQCSKYLLLGVEHRSLMLIRAKLKSLKCAFPVSVRDTEFLVGWPLLSVEA